MLCLWDLFYLEISFRWLMLSWTFFVSFLSFLFGTLFAYASITSPEVDGCPFWFLLLLKPYLFRPFVKQYRTSKYFIYSCNILFVLLLPLVVAYSSCLNLSGDVVDGHEQFQKQAPLDWAPTWLGALLTHLSLVSVAAFDGLSLYWEVSLQVKPLAWGLHTFIVKVFVNIVIMSFCVTNWFWAFQIGSKILCTCVCSRTHPTLVTQVSVSTMYCPIVRRRASTAGSTSSSKETATTFISFSSKMHCKGSFLFKLLFWNMVAFAKIGTSNR